MAESPDYNPIEFSPFPPDPTLYIASAADFSINTASSVTIESLNDGRLYAIKSWTIRGTILNTSTTTNAIAFVSMFVKLGLDNTGTNAFLDGGRYYLNPSSSGYPPGSLVPFNFQATTPIVIRGGTVAAPNNLDCGLVIESGAVQVDGVGCIVAWPLD